MAFKKLTCRQGASPNCDCIKNCAEVIRHALVLLEYCDEVILKSFRQGKVKWLVPIPQVKRSFDTAFRTVLSMYRERAIPGWPTAGLRVCEYFDEFRPNFSQWRRENFEALVECCTDNPDALLSNVHQDFDICPTRFHQPLANFFKLVFTLMWSRKQMVLPLEVRSVTNMEDVYDQVAELGDSEALKKIRECLRYDIEHTPKDERDLNKRTYTRWTKLLLSGEVWSGDDLNPEYCLDVYKRSVGRRKPLEQYRVSQLLYFLAGDNAAARKIVDSAIESVRSENEVVHKAAREARKEKTAAQKSPTIAQTACSTALEYAWGKKTLVLNELFANTVKPYAMAYVFDMRSAKQDLYGHLPERVEAFCKYIDATFRSFVKSKRLQGEGAHYQLLNTLLAYLTTYLPSFYVARDGDLTDYPTCLNDFDCTLFFTREANFEAGVLSFDKEPPMTFLAFLGAYASYHSWGNETWYARVLCADEYCAWIEENRLTLKGADRFSNNFCAACYPPVKRSQGTVKRPIPRAYFGAFVSMLYSMEYLVMHLNMMGDGSMPGVSRGELYHPNIAELQESSEWESLWGKGEGRLTVIDQSKLNYCPIFYYNGKIYKFDFLPRFYRIADYEIAGQRVPRVIPNHVRLAQLMCETGLRQKHLIWLDRDQYDCMLDRSSKSQLAPLFVSSDKSHGEWTAIVARHVMAILDRQRKWYGQCSAPEYKEKVWYGFKKESKFGQFRPLFRMLNAGEDAWANYRFYPVMLSILQHFIQHQMADSKIVDLVRVRAQKWGEETPVTFTKEFFSEIIVDDLISDYTPHGLRAGFISEAVRFLPAWMVGQYMTGQNEQHVWYYAIFEEDDLPSHQKLLANYLLKNTERLNSAEAPELATAVIQLNERLARDIKADPVKAIETYGLISLIGVKEDQTGVEVLRAQRHTGLAYNTTHICPFRNRCPLEIVKSLGAGRPCALCPYAIRGVAHLPAISAEKDKCKEHMIAIVRKLKHYRDLKHSAVDRQAIETLNRDHDTYAREAWAYEAIEEQLYQMAVKGQRGQLFARNKAGLEEHFRKVQLTEVEHVVKRLLDVQNFPDASSPELDVKFAYLRSVLMMQKGNLEELLKISEHTPGVELASQISSMVNSGSLDVMDVFRIGQSVARPVVSERPDSVILQRIGHRQAEEHHAEPEEGHI